MRASTSTPGNRSAGPFGASAFASPGCLEEIAWCSDLMASEYAFSACSAFSMAVRHSASKLASSSRLVVSFLTRASTLCCESLRALDLSPIVGTLAAPAFASRSSFNLSSESSLSSWSISSLNFFVSSSASIWLERQASALGLL